MPNMAPRFASKSRKKKSRRKKITIALASQADLEAAARLSDELDQYIGSRIAMRIDAVRAEMKRAAKAGRTWDVRRLADTIEGLELMYDEIDYADLFDVAHFVVRPAKQQQRG